MVKAHSAIKCFLPHTLKPNLILQMHINIHNQHINMHIFFNPSQGEWLYG